MKAKNNNPINLIKKNKINEITKIYFQLNHLKQLLRQGWLRYIPEKKCETVADHSFGVALLALFVAERHYPQLDKHKVLKMALIHELAEVVIGDLTPFDGITLERKREKELKAFKKIFKNLPGKDSYIKLFEEYKEGRTKEARFVQQVGYLETALQAKIYQKQYKKNLGEFITSAQERVKDRKLKELLEELKDI